MQPSEFIEASGGDPARFRELLEAALDVEIDDFSLDELDDRIIQLLDVEPSLAVQLAEVTAELYARFDREVMYAYAANTLVGAYAKTGEAEKFLAWLMRGVEHVIAHDLKPPGASIVGNAVFAMNSELLDRDEYLVVLRETIKFHEHFKQIAQAVTAYCAAAAHFGQLGAFQSAYRILEDAFELARETKSVGEIPKLFYAQAAVASDEGDITYAEKHFTKAITLLRRLRGPVPPEYLMNQATMRMQQGKLKPAAAVFKRLIDDPGLNAERRFACAINLAVCRRGLGARDAVRTVERALSLRDENFSVESLTELELVACKTYTGAGRFDEAAVCLAAAVRLIDGELLSIGRLHYRRGFRERYVGRLGTLVCEFPERGEAGAVLPALAVVKSSGFSDWACVLDWCEAMLNGGELSPAQSEELAARLAELVEQGAPLLLGFREKYEDPFESPETPQTKALNLPSYNLPWRNFNLIVRDICLFTGAAHPFDAASAARIEALLAGKLAAGSCLLNVLNTTDACHLIALAGGSYVRVSLPHDPFVVFYESLLRYEAGEGALGELLKPLDAAVAALSAGLKGLLEELGPELPRELVVIPDNASDMLPLVPALLADERIREGLRAGGLELKYCPILHPARRREASDALLGVWDSRDPLPLAREEVESLIRVLGPRTSDLLDLGGLTHDGGDEEELVTRAERCGYLHLASHGVSIGNFTDPFYASLAGPGKFESLSVNMIQQHFWRFPYALAVLNACHTSIITSHNYQRQFKTNEIISYPTLLLLNRRSQVVASQWVTFDTAAYVFTNFFYGHIRGGRTPAYAYASALVDLYDADKAAVLKVLEQIADPQARADAAGRISGLKREHPFRHPFCYGTYIFHSLL
jgi:tetratricopeptide (TPR) repeat protein